MNQRELYKVKAVEIPQSKVPPSDSTVALEQQLEDLEVLAKSDKSTQYPKVKAVNYYGDELKSKDLVVVPTRWDLLALIISNHPVQLAKGDEGIRELLEKSYKELAVLHFKLFGMSVDSRQVSRDEFRRRYWPKEYYLRFKESGSKFNSNG